MKRYWFLLLTALFFPSLVAQPTKTATERRMEQQGMVDVRTVEPSLKVRLMYARPDNFTGRVLYTDLHTAYLHPSAAAALKKAQAALRKRHPAWSLVIFDATRPMSVQQTMWDVVKNTPQHIYVSNPANGGGLHNYGLAVDISICNERGDTLSMGAKVDHLGSLSHIDNEDRLVREGRLTPQARANRRLLREVMAAGGFRCLRTEWWHFNFKSRAEAKRRYKVIR